MTSVTLTFGRERQEAQKFKVVLSYVLSCLKKKKKKPLGSVTYTIGGAFVWGLSSILKRIYS